MRNMSFALTTKQVRNGTKTITRRPGWKFLKPGDRIMACVKCQGIKKGTLERIREIEVVSVMQEPLSVLLEFPRQYIYAMGEMEREGFSGTNPRDFVVHFLKMYKGLTTIHPISRIQFKYV